MGGERGRDVERERRLDGARMKLGQTVVVVGAERVGRPRSGAGERERGKSEVDGGG
jgi:hypothetical protein